MLLLLQNSQDFRIKMNCIIFTRSFAYSLIHKNARVLEKEEEKDTFNSKVDS
jgi:hypothetical protein